MSRIPRNHPNRLFQLDFFFEQNHFTFFVVPFIRADASDFRVSYEHPDDDYYNYDTLMYNGDFFSHSKKGKPQVITTELWNPIVREISDYYKLNGWGLTSGGHVGGG